MRGTVSPQAERWIRGSAVIAMIIVALSSAVLSFDGLQKLALESMVPSHLAFLFPIAIDTTILMGSLAVLLYEMFGIRAVFGWFTVLFGTALSVVGNVISVVDAGITAQVLHGIIPILLCISLESLLRILRFNIKRTVSMEYEDNKEYVEKGPIVVEPAVVEPAQTAEMRPEPVLELPVAAAPSLDMASEAVERPSPVAVELEPVSLPIHDLSVLEASESVPEEKVEKPTPTETKVIETEFKKTATTETAKPVTQKTMEASPTKPMKKPTAKRSGVGYAPLASDEREQFKALVDTFPEDYPVYKRLGEVMRVNSKISSADVRYILSYEDDKRVDNLMKRAREFAVNS